MRCAYPCSRLEASLPHEEWLRARGVGGGAAGGIASPRGVAAALAAGAEGAWVGTALLASPECDNTERARTHLIQAGEADTVLTRVFDVGQRIPWPPQYPGRALHNHFSEQ